MILDVLKQQLGVDGLIFFPFIFTLFFFIFFCNFFSLIPFGFALTSHISLLFFLSFSLSLSVFFLGLGNFGFKFFKIFVPESPFFLLFILIPIEIFSYFIRAFSLAIRLSANIMAGHTLVYIMSMFFISLGKLRVWFFFIIFFFFFIFVLEFGVSFLQAYVFITLFCIYLNDSVKGSLH
jgi:F-type H+-transporting ATPase subunit a